MYTLCSVCLRLYLLSTPEWECLQEKDKCTRCLIWLKLRCLCISQLAAQKHLAAYLDTIMPVTVNCKHEFTANGEYNAEFKCHHIQFAY